MKDDISSDKGISFPVDPNLPRWQCQNCHHALCIVGVDSYCRCKLSTDPELQNLQFNVKDKHVFQECRVLLFMVEQAALWLQLKWIIPLYTRASGKAMEDSFVVLPPAAASMYNSESGSDGGSHIPSSGGIPGNHLHPNNSDFYSGITVLKRAFDIATTQTQVEQPLCLECMRVLSDKLDKEVDDANKDIKAYEACLQRLEGETRDVMSETDFFREKLKVCGYLFKIEEEERRLEAAIEETEKQCIKVDAELKDLEVKSNRFKDLEERYCHEFNNFQFQLTRHQ
ncbi:hypothetical protein MKX03_010067, partial [Papaver bracteatum]